jgi:NADPH:quinone reductase-like Zn-dependent oxidoreductase
MKAIVWTKYGSPDGLRLQEVATPTPGDDQLLIKVHATTVSTADSEIRRLKFPWLIAIPTRLYLGLIKPARVKIAGTEFAGEIVAVGREITRFQPGDQVFGYTGLGMGTYAEYLCLTDKPGDMAAVVAKKPANASYEEAAAVVFGGLEAVNSLGKAHIQPGQKVLIKGAGGGIGICAVQLAKHLGAEVTGVDHTVKLDTIRALGADHVIDYTREDFTQSGRAYDVIFDTFGKSSYPAILRSLNENGVYVNENPALLDGFRVRRYANRSGKRIVLWKSGYTIENLLALKELIEAGTIKAVIDRRYPLEQAAEAHRYVDTGLKKGYVVLTVALAPRHSSARPG